MGWFKDARMAQVRKNEAYMERRQKANKGHLHCEYCGDSVVIIYHYDHANQGRADQATVDHIQPKSKNGSDHPSNLCVACLSCNRRKGDQWPYPAPSHPMADCQSSGYGWLLSTVVVIVLAVAGLSTA